MTPSTRGLLATAASVAVIAGLYAAPSGPAARLLALPVPRFLGQISYGTYLWHWPVILVVGQLFDVGSLVLVALAAPVATGLAALSYEIFERPIRKAPGPGPVPLAGGRRGPGGQPGRGDLRDTAAAAGDGAAGGRQPRARRPLRPGRAGRVAGGARTSRPRPGRRARRRPRGRRAVHDRRPRGVRPGDRQRRTGPARRRQPVSHVRDGVRVPRPRARLHAPHQRRPRLRLAGRLGAPVRGRAHHVLPRRAPPARRRHGGGRQPLPR